MTQWSWSVDHTPPAMAQALRMLEEEYPLTHQARGGPGRGVIAFAPASGAADSYRLKRTGHTVTVHYSSLSAGLRAVGTILSGLNRTAEQRPFSLFGIMLDCSRNSVMTVTHFKTWLRKLALLGFNSAMLYTEDTYRIPGEDYFGIFRGAYTPEELREIDQYAAALGIEMIPCIQTLGHLEQMLRWSAYEQIRDTRSVLLADEPETYRFIEKIVAQCADCFKSKRIHIGMDETHDLGRGRFMDRFGPQRNFDIFNRHLRRVSEICGQHDLRPMIWSDMYFRMGSKNNDYYDKNSVFPSDLKKEIPSGVELIYWDYYHYEEAFYDEWIRRHRSLDKEPVMACGLWTWFSFWHRREQTYRTAGPCIRACKRAGIREFFVTMWGDDGAYCDFDSAMAGLNWIAENVYANRASEAALRQRFAAVCHGDLAASDAPSQEILGDAGLVWDDPLIWMYFRNEELRDPKVWIKRKKECTRLIARLRRCRVRTTAGGDIPHALILSTFVQAKIALFLKIRQAYPQRHRRQLKAVAAAAMAMAKMMDQVDQSFCRQWRRRNKPQGLEVMQIRWAGQKRRYQELAERIRLLLAGSIDHLAELEEKTSTALDLSYPPFRSVAVGTTII